MRSSIELSVRYSSTSNISNSNFVRSTFISDFNTCLHISKFLRKEIVIFTDHSYSTHPQIVINGLKFSSFSYNGNTYLLLLSRFLEFSKSDFSILLESLTSQIVSSDLGYKIHWTHDALRVAY